MVWTKLNDTYTDDCATLSDAAFRTHTEALNWTMRRETEGRITVRDLRRFAETDNPEKAVAELVDVEWWEDHDSGDGWQVIRDMHYQRTKEQIEADRGASADRQRRWREAHAKKKPRPAADDEPREDVERLCTYLADRIEAGGSKRPTIGKRWRDAARLLLDEDKRTEEQVRIAIDWCQANSFWRSHIMSMAKLREKYDTLRLQWVEEHKRNAGTTSANGHGGMRGGARQQLMSAEEIDALDPGSIA